MTEYDPSISNQYLIVKADGYGSYNFGDTAIMNPNTPFVTTGLENGWLELVE